MTIPNPDESASQIVSVPLGYQDSVTVSIKGVKLESVPVKRQSPITIIKHKIRVDEHQMEDGEPYAFRYLGKIYMLTRTNKKLTLYELQ